jgi:hypothetical protein
MTISRMAVCCLLLLATLLWLPSSAGAQGATACREAMEKMTNQAEAPSNDELARFKAKCGTQEAGSLKNIDFYRNRVKAYREKLAEAVAIVKMAVEMLTQQPASTGQEGNQ